MEPDLGGQEKHGLRHRFATAIYQSQWSLTLEVRKSTNNSYLEYLASKSQWSLTLEVRKSVALLVDDFVHLSVAMEPDLGGQEKSGKESSYCSDR